LGARIYVAAVIEGIYRNIQLKVSYVTAGDVIAPLSPTELRVEGGDYGRAKQNKYLLQK
jgi:hypothetical protein